MAMKIFRKWYHKWRHHPCGQDMEADSVERAVFENGFSPASYQNPCISQMHPILMRIIEQKKISYQNLEPVIIDAEEGLDGDSDDIQIVLSGLTEGLNYLLLITDRPDSYTYFMDRMYEENGLIVQHISKSARKGACGNLILDFERSGGMSAESMACPDAIYLPIYKKPWEISENLDIIVPVGYNTLVVDGIFLPQPEGCRSTDGKFMENMINIDRLDQEFRKG